MKTPTVSQDQPLISVVMPVYNAERYVAEAIDSILAQTYPYFEFIIVDDGSTDGSAGIVRAFASRDTRIRTLFLPHRGQSIALNAGIALAQGQFIAHMDNDDIALPERFAIQLAWMRERNVDVCGGYLKTFGDLNSVIWFPVTHEAICLEQLFRVGLHHGSSLVRVAIAKTHLFDERVFYTDYEMLTRLATRYRLSNVPQILLKWRRYPQQTHMVYNTTFLAEQRQFRKPYFHTLFPQATADDYIAIELAAERKSASNLAELELTGKWLARLAQTHDNFLRERMARRWLTTCQRSAHLGPACYRLYRQILPEFDLSAGKGSFKLRSMCALRLGSDSWVYKILTSAKRFLSVNIRNRVEQRRGISDLM